MMCIAAKLLYFFNLDDTFCNFPTTFLIISFPFRKTLATFAHKRWYPGHPGKFMPLGLHHP